MADSKMQAFGSERGWTPLALVLLGSVWIASVGNWPLWRTLAQLPEMSTGRGTLFVAAFGVMVAALTTGLLALAAWRRTVKPAIAIVVLSAAIGAYFMGTYGVVLDPTMMTNVLQTDPREAGDLLGWRFIANVALIGVLPLVWLWRAPIRRMPVARQALHNVLAFVGCALVLVALIALFFADLSATMRNHRSLRYLINPANAYFSLGVIAKQANARPAGPLETISADAHVRPRAAGTRPPLVVLVVGETARADHFALNGYARPTNPELAREDIVSFTHVTSCGTNTAASLPCMFSALGRSRFEARERDQENLLDVAQRAGLAVLWVDNQSGCKGLCDRVPHAAAIEPASGTALPSELCSDGECFDEALLVGLDQRLAALPAERRERGVLIVLHQMGSHGPAYFKRSPPNRKPFQPECASTVLQQCALETLVNAYDNSIAYTDHVLAATIHWLERHAAGNEPVLVYLSDHGESLGENNIFLHGLPYALAPREQTHVPMVVWFGADGTAGRSARTACLRERRDAPLSHDHLFHTVLGLLDVETREYQKALDAVAPCRGR
ncbi:MAG: phosphoethanolamine--lipid A transferase [Caldimonas sp.]